MASTTSRAFKPSWAVMAGGLPERMDSTRCGDEAMAHHAGIACLLGKIKIEMLVGRLREFARVAANKQPLFDALERRAMPA